VTPVGLDDGFAVRVPLVGRKRAELVDDPERAQARLRIRLAQQRLNLVVDFLPVGDMPPPGPKPFFSLLDQTLSVQLGRQIGRPFWIDTVGKSNLVEIRILLDDAVMRVFAQRSAAYASNSEIFLFWMVGTSSILLIVAVLFLRNQIRPILRLADAAESFGKGREAPNFRPRGAREVRRAAHAFLEMKARVERAMEQRTAMLAGVSHDLRTILTRFKLELALIGDTPELDAMRKDVDEMSGMLEDYLAFARGDSGENAQPTDMTVALEELRSDAERHGHCATVAFHGLPVVIVNPSTPVGPGDIRPTPTGRLILEAARGQMPAFVDTGLNIVHVDDVAAGHLAAAEKGRIGDRYILGGENMSLAAILAAVSRQVGRRPPRLRLPHALLFPVAFGAEIAARLIGREPFVTLDGVRMSRKKMYFTSKKAANELGYRPRPAREAIADAVSWFRTNGYLQ